MYRFKFSIVMAVYNVELFVAEAIESVLKQDIGFKENVQLILVDDGSKDSSGKICDEYALKYPQNIIVIHKENGGVSSARNEGLEYVEGKYVNFLDSDDKLSNNTLSSVFRFFEKHYNETDVVAIPMMFFEGAIGGHILNYKFDNGSRVINLKEEYNCIQLSMSSAFCKSEDILKLKFDIKLSHMEDAKVCIMLLAKKLTLGVVTKAKYCYRRRLQGGSAVQRSVYNKGFYTCSIENFSKDIMNYFDCTHGSVPFFVQYTVMYDLQWKLTTSLKIVKSTLTKYEIQEFKEKIFELLHRFDDKIILEQRNISIEYKTFLLGKKYDVIPEVKEDFDGDLAIFVKDTFIIKLHELQTKLEFLNIDEDKAALEFTCTYIGNLDSVINKVFLQCNDNIVVCSKIEQRLIHITCFDEVIATQVTYRCIVGLKDATNIRICEVINEKTFERSNLVSGKFFPIVTSFKKSYAIIKGYFISTKDTGIEIKKANVIKNIFAEIKLLKEYLEIGIPAAKKAIISRCLYHIVKPWLRKEIWLISDRINKADDNGEAFFKWLNENNVPVNSYFVIRKDSADYPVVAKLGKVLDYRSWKHKFYHLLADKTVSAAADEFVYNHFGINEKYYRDILINKRHIFLQHGITQNDLSRWLNRYNKNLSMFVTAAVPEYESIVNGSYFYDDSVVKLTGFARFDRLVDESEKIITIMPTWRSNLVDKSKSVTDTVDGIKRYDISFKDTKYFHFYNKLLNNELLLKNAKEYGYKIRFMPHPNVINFIDWFDKSDEVEFCSISTKYRDIFSTSSLVLTDYSSVAFDFAYLRKPLIYAHFDKKEFDVYHTHDKGYFDYESDGFGEVEYDLDSTVNRLIEYMENGCRLKDKYRERIDEFFAFSDRNNCKRIYEAIKSLEQ